MRKFFIILFICPILSFAKTDKDQFMKNFYPNTTNQLLPEVHFNDIEQNKLILDQFEGKLLLVNFWASWCMDCREEIKQLNLLQKDLRKHPIRVLPISIDYKKIDAIKQFYETHKINYLEVYQDEKANLYNALHLYGLPNTLVINEKGDIIGTFKGVVNWTQPELQNWLISLTKHINYNYMQDKDYQKFLQEKINQQKIDQPKADQPKIEPQNLNQEKEEEKK